MDTPQIDIVRGGRLPGLQLRADGDVDEGQAADVGLGTMTGHFSVFGAWYEIHSWWEGDFLERVAPGAFRDTFAAHWSDDDAHRIKVMYDHGLDYSIGDKLLGRVETLREDKTGAYYEVPLFDTSYNRDLAPGLEAGEYGASFRFRVGEEHWVDDPGTSEHNPKGLPERTILGTDTREFGPTPFGASPTATAGMRSLTDAYYETLRVRSPGLFEEACRAAGREIPTGRAAARSTAGGGPGDEPTPPVQLPAEVRHRDLLLRGVIPHEPR